MAKFSVVAGVVGLLGMLAGPFLLILTDHGGGLAERVALYPLIIWLIALGGKKLLADRKSESIQKSDFAKIPSLRA
jgi:hypothetical protein